MTAMIVHVRPGGAGPTATVTAPTTTAFGPDAPLDLEAFCAASRLHPDLVRRLVTLGLLDADADASGHFLLAARSVARAARIERLRRDLGITYTATGVVLDLLDRIDDLEQLLRTRPG